MNRHLNLYEDIENNGTYLITLNVSCIQLSERNKLSYICTGYF
jgi:hypothetical protein